MRLFTSIVSRFRRTRHCPRPIRRRVAFEILERRNLLNGDPVLNEFVFNHTGTDTHEFVEIFGDPSADYSAFTVLEIEGDSTGAGRIDGVFPVGTTDANGFWTTEFLSNVIENGTVTLLLVDGFSGSMDDDLDDDNNGSLDASPWIRIIDAIGVTDGGGSDHNYTSVVLSPGFDGNSFTPGGASRIPNGTDTDSVADWIRNDFAGAGLPGFSGDLGGAEALNTPGGVNQAVADPVLNEFVANHVGSDTMEFVEIFGDPSIDYSAFAVIQIEGDAGAGGGGPGAIDSVFPVGTTDAGGFWRTSFRSGDLENGTLTLLLVQGFSSSSGTDLDTDDDGSLDASPWIRIIDAIGVTDGGGSDHNYTSVVLSPGFDGNSFTPGGASRIPNGTDTDSVADWIRNDFAGEGLLTGVVGTAEPGEALNTPGSTNNAVPLCSLAHASVETLWPPNHKFVSIDILGVTDPDGDSLAITIDSIFQDEPVNAQGSGNTSVDGRGIGTATAEVRAERAGGGNGRVYHISFTASDGPGGTCSGVVQVGVPKSSKRTPIDDGPLFDSTVSVSVLVLGGLSTGVPSALGDATSGVKVLANHDDEIALPEVILAKTPALKTNASSLAQHNAARDRVFATLNDSQDDQENFWTKVFKIDLLAD